MNSMFTSFEETDNLVLIMICNFSPIEQHSKDLNIGSIYLQNDRHTLHPAECIQISIAHKSKSKLSYSA